VGDRRLPQIPIAAAKTPPIATAKTLPIAAAKTPPIDTVEPLASRDTHFQDGPIRGTEAQELSDGLDLTFDAWKRQILARFRDDPGWYNSEERKMLRRTKGDAQIQCLPA
jgi:hypothetical protein